MQCAVIHNNRVHPSGTVVDITGAWFRTRIVYTAATIWVTSMYISMITINTNAVRMLGIFVINNLWKSTGDTIRIAPWGSTRYIILNEV